MHSWTNQLWNVKSYREIYDMKSICIHSHILYVCTHIHVCRCKYVSVENTGWCQVSTSNTLHLTFETELSMSVKPAGQWTPGTQPSPLPVLRIHVCQHTSFLCGMGIQTQVLVLMKKVLFWLYSLAKILFYRAVFKRKVLFCSFSYFSQFHVCLLR